MERVASTCEPSEAPHPDPLPQAGEGAQTLSGHIAVTGTSNPEAAVVAQSIVLIEIDTISHYIKSNNHVL